MLDALLGLCYAACRQGQALAKCVKDAMALYGFFEIVWPRLLPPPAVAAAAPPAFGAPLVRGAPLPLLPEAPPPVQEIMRVPFPGRARHPQDAPYFEFRAPHGRMGNLRWLCVADMRR